LPAFLGIDRAFLGIDRAFLSIDRAAEWVGSGLESIKRCRLCRNPAG
jgi:hypothetical protein